MFPGLMSSLFFSTCLLIAMLYVSEIEVLTVLVGRVIVGMKYYSSVDLKNVLTL